MASRASFNKIGNTVIITPDPGSGGLSAARTEMTRGVAQTEPS
ncbi:hypothetical protein [Microvirga brassicacearum]|nr:hypothetical protein [Microvirga brassicacearum]